MFEIVASHAVGCDICARMDRVNDQYDDYSFDSEEHEWLWTVDTLAAAEAVKNSLRFLRLDYVVIIPAMIIDSDCAVSA